MREKRLSGFEPESSSLEALQLVVRPHLDGSFLIEYYSLALRWFYLGYKL
jgi:hypothetical protein